MQDRFKSRAWDIKNKRMITPDYICGWTGKPWEGVPPDNVELYQQELILMQCTCQKHKQLEELQVFKLL